MVVSKYYHLKIILKLWAIIFLVGANLLRFIGVLLKQQSYDIFFFDNPESIITILGFIIGCVTLLYLDSIKLQN